MLITVFTMFLVINLKINFLVKKRGVILLMIIVSNLCSLVPYGVCVSCYIWNNFILAVILIVAIIVKLLRLKLNEFLRQLLPYACPTGLWDILFFLEIIRFMIRPLTLSLRITCNLLTGHVLLTLISDLGHISTFLVLFFYLFEIGVAVIQRYVFTLLSALYMAD